jgi:hypothetical protein
LIYYTHSHINTSKLKYRDIIFIQYFIFLSMYKLHRYTLSPVKVYTKNYSERICLSGFILVLRYVGLIFFRENCIYIILLIFNYYNNLCYILYHIKLLLLTFELYRFTIRQCLQFEIILVFSWAKPIFYNIISILRNHMQITHKIPYYTNF